MVPVSWVLGGSVPSHWQGVEVGLPCDTRDLFQRWLNSKGALVHSLELSKYFKGSGMPYHIEKDPPEVQES